MSKNKEAIKLAIKEIALAIEWCKYPRGAEEHGNKAINILESLLRAEEPEAGDYVNELKFTLHNKTHEIVGYLRLKDGWNQYATKDEPDYWFYPCSFKWNHQHCDIIDSQAAENRKLIEDLDAECRISQLLLAEQKKLQLEIKSLKKKLNP